MAEHKKKADDEKKVQKKAKADAEGKANSGTLSEEDFKAARTMLRVEMRKMDAVVRQLAGHCCHKVGSPIWCHCGACAIVGCHELSAL